MRAELEAKGVAVKEGRWGYRLLVVDDPDGNQFFFNYPSETASGKVAGDEAGAPGPGRATRSAGVTLQFREVFKRLVKYRHYTHKKSVAGWSANLT